MPGADGNREKKEVQWMSLPPVEALIMGEEEQSTSSLLPQPHGGSE